MVAPFYGASAEGRGFAVFFVPGRTARKGLGPHELLVYYGRYRAEVPGRLEVPRWLAGLIPDWAGGRIHPDRPGSLFAE